MGSANLSKVALSPWLAACAFRDSQLPPSPLLPGRYLLGHPFIVIILILKVVIVLTCPQFWDSYIADSNGEYCKGFHRLLILCTTIPIYRENYGLVGAICINVDFHYLNIGFSPVGIGMMMHPTINSTGKNQRAMLGILRWPEILNPNERLLTLV